MIMVIIVLYWIHSREGHRFNFIMPTFPAYVLLSHYSLKEFVNIKSIIAKETKFDEVPVE